MSISPDSAKANVTICGFGDTVKAALVIVGLAYNKLDNSLDYYPSIWDYKYGYTVEKHWKSDVLPAWNVAWFDSIHVNGDVIVYPGKTVTLEPGTIVEFYPGDTLHVGTDPNRCELVLTQAGSKLVAQGAPSEMIHFRSGASAPTKLDWYGIQTLPGSSPFEPSYCTFEHAAYPIVCNSDTVVVKACRFSDFWGDAINGIYSNVTVEDTRIDMSDGNNTGIKLRTACTGMVTGDSIMSSGYGTAVKGVSADSLTVSHNTISNPYTGIHVEASGLNSSHNRILGFVNDGIKVSGSTVSISYDTLEIGSTGVRGIELTSTSSGTVSHNYITSSGSGTRYGIETSGDASPVIEYNQINGPMCGIRCTGNSGPQIAHNWIKNTTGNGIQCSGDGGPSVRYTTIENFQGTAVSAADYALLNLGAYPDSGSNRIYTSQSFSYYVANLAEDPMLAEYNWWGTSNPSSGKFYGDVDYLPCDTLDPGTSYSLPLLPIVSPMPWEPYAMQSYPNPFNPRTTIEYGVSNPANVRVAVYDISGRVVRMLVDDLRPQGRFTVVWDGRDERGGIVASGVYFYEVVIGEFREAKKLVVLR
jgi:hypothetical protein